MEDWPVVAGNYEVGDWGSAVAVVTLSDSFFGLEKAAIVGPLKTENLGIEKVVANIVSNPNIRFLIVCGKEVMGHRSGQTICALHKNGVDDKNKIIGSEGAIPYIENLPSEAIERFQDQIELISLIEEQNIERIQEEIDDCLGKALNPYPAEPITSFAPPKVEVSETLVGKRYAPNLVQLEPSIDLVWDPEKGEIAVFKPRNLVTISPELKIHPFRGEVFGE